MKVIAFVAGTGYLWKGFYPVSLQEAIARGTHLRPFDLPINIKVRWILAEYLKRNYQNKFYAKAQNLVPALRQAYDTALKDVDVLVMPTMFRTADPLPTKDSSVKGTSAFSKSILLYDRCFF